MGSILTRILELANNEGVTIGYIERKIGASKGVLSRAIAKNTDIQAKWIQILVENYPQYSVRWLITGKGDMIELSCEEKKIIPGDNIELIKMLMDQLGEKNEEIGRLKEKITGLIDDIRLMQETDVAHDADTGHSAAG